MQPLIRQWSRSSILSRWSDSNPPGATVSLHAAAKPLMRFMYNRQALNLIKNNKPGTLSSALLEVYSAYLSCKYVSLATKVAVLRELRGVTQEDGPRAVILGDELALRQVVELAISADITNTLRIEACGILGNMVLSPTATHSQRTELCKSLVSILRDNDISVTTAARDAMSSTLKAAEASIDVDVLDCLTEILGSPDKDVRAGARQLLTKLASHPFERTCGLRLCVWLVSCLCVAETDVIEAATHALSRVARSSEGAKTVIDAKTANYVEQLLRSKSDEIRRETWELNKQLAFHEISAPVIFSVILRVHDFDLPDGLPADAIYTLMNIAERFDRTGWQWEVVDNEALGGIAKLLKSQQPLVRRFACTLLRIATPLRRPY
ncbi:armadillo-type protein [Mycena polygramma]|nr:armadillo-type protein [Mycena polygramma]